MYSIYIYILYIAQPTECINNLSLKWEFVKQKMKNKIKKVWEIRVAIHQTKLSLKDFTEEFMNNYRDYERIVMNRKGAKTRPLNFYYVIDCYEYTKTKNFIRQMEKFKEAALMVEGRKDL